MRTIKFRAWDVEDKEWRTDLNFYIDSNNEKVVFISGVASNGLEIMQFTGLKDKNGKEIYEGDIIKWFADGMHKFAEVIWKDCGWCAKRIDKELNEFEKYYPFNQFIPVEINRNGHIDFFDGEVIGNIYENSELLKIGEKK